MDFRIADTFTDSLARLASVCIYRSAHDPQAVRATCKVLGRERLAGLTIHHGRHTFISHALAGGRTLAEVRDAAGHSNVTITSTYLHVDVNDDELIGNLFAV
jgi:integrase/recombinase XerD